LYPVDVLADCALVASTPSRVNGVDEHRDTSAKSSTSSESQTRAFSTGKVQFRIVHIVSGTQYIPHCYGFGC
uniref:MIR domain-containing protein n=1 Tax=Echinostoma caproni TaxID=27848 RepID=A0A183BGB2_9TREM